MITSANLVSRENIDEYIRCCREERRLDAKTLRAYKCDLGQVLGWMEAGGVERFDRASAKAYLAHLNGAYAPASVKRKMASLRAFGREVIADGCVAPRNLEGVCVDRIAYHGLAITWRFEPFRFFSLRTKAYARQMGVKTSTMTAMKQYASIGALRLRCVERLSAHRGMVIDYARRTRCCRCTMLGQ